MAHVKVAVSITNATIGDNHVEAFNFNLDTEYSEQELLAVIGAIPDYMAKLLAIAQEVST